MKVEITESLNHGSKHIFYLSETLECECGALASHTIIDSWDNKPVMYLCDGCSEKYRRQTVLI